MEDDKDLENEVNDIISQIKNQGKKINLTDVEKEYPELSPDQVDSFILKYASQVVINLAKAVEELADVVKDGGTANEIIALAELGKSFQGNLEVLQKRKIADNKNKTQKDVKQMDIDARVANPLLGNGEGSGGIYASRQEILKSMATVLLENGKKSDPPVSVDPNPPIDI